jgi:hypothetical protein
LGDLPILGAANMFSIRYHLKIPALFLLIALLVICFVGCLAATNYYTARTLKKGKMMISFGTDNIFFQSTDEGLQFNKDLPFSPSMGLAIGLPYRFETGLRWYYLKTFEGTVRWQVNPVSFKYFDFSTNVHYGSFHLEVNYFKYGFTMSKQIAFVEPFVSYYWYANGDLNHLSDKDYSDALSTNLVLCFGMAIGIINGYIIPEINYQYVAGTFNEALVFYSIGFKLIFA